MPLRSRHTRAFLVASFPVPGTSLLASCNSRKNFIQFWHRGRNTVGRDFGIGRAMSTEKANGEGPRKLKILMLHGFTQSGPLFHAKTRALEKILTKAFPALPPAPHNCKASPGNLLSYPGGIQLIYPTAPIRLQPADIPGFSASEQSESEKEDPDAWGWWKKDSSTGEYIGLDEGLETIRKAIEEVGGIDGVIGFSQGGAMAAMLAALLEDGRESHFLPSSPLPYPPSYLSLRSTLPQQPLRFAVSYSGFYAQPELYKPFYEPKIKTRFLHVIGSLDSVVEEERSQGLVERCEEEVRTKVVHPGGHFVPVGREYAGVLVGWLRDVLSEKKVDEESVEDMDMPF